MADWKVEKIPIDAVLYCFIHKEALNHSTRKPVERAFRNTPFIGGTDLSSDWSKYSTPDETRNRVGSQQKPNGSFKNPADYYVIRLLVSQILTELPTQNIEHNPLPTNRAHTKILGEKDVEVRLKFFDLCNWEISPW